MNRLPKLYLSIRLHLIWYLLLGHLSLAQPPQYKMQVYISTWSELAVSQMVDHGIPASVTLAQAIFESRCGGSELAKRSNNHFGIKCHVEWEGDTIVKHDDTLNECFRRYPSVEESFTDHSLFLSKRPRYAQLFELPQGDYRAWCKGLKEAGYATYERYAEDLIRLIEQTELYRLDGVQSLPPKKAFEHDRREPRPSQRNAEQFGLTDFCLGGLLFTDELYAHVRSLHLVLRLNPFPKKS